MNVHMVRSPSYSKKDFEEMCLISGENSEITIADNDSYFGNTVWR